MKAYHGTTRENANNILSGGCKSENTWNCSDDECLYLWCPETFIEFGEAEDVEDSEYMALQRAFESGQITAATSKTPQYELVVLCFEFDKEYIEEDQSCENMELARCIELGKYKPSHVKTLTCKHNPRLDALVINAIIDNAELPKHKLDESLIEAAEALKGVWLESLYEFDWEAE